jgi:hypothetical protein
MYDKRVRSPKPGSESGANVQQAIRERVRAHCFCRQRPPKVKAGYKPTWLYPGFGGKEAGATRKGANLAVPGV